MAEIEMTEKNEYQVILDLLSDTASYSKDEFPKNITAINFDSLKANLLKASYDSSFVPRSQIEKVNEQFDDEGAYFLQLAKLYFTALNRTERIDRSVPREQLNYTFAI